MAFLDKLKSGLSKTKKALFGQIEELVKVFVKVDEELLEELDITVFETDSRRATKIDVICKKPLTTNA